MQDSFKVEFSMCASYDCFLKNMVRSQPRSARSSQNSIMEQPKRDKKNTCVVVVTVVFVSLFIRIFVF